MFTHFLCLPSPLLTKEGNPPLPIVGEGWGEGEIVNE